MKAKMLAVDLPGNRTVQAGMTDTNHVVLSFEKPVQENDPAIVELVDGRTRLRFALTLDAASALLLSLAPCFGEIFDDNPSYLRALANARKNLGTTAKFSAYEVDNLPLPEAVELAE